MNKTPNGLPIKLDSIHDAIEAIKNGEVIIVVDDEDRENEGDFVCAASCVTPEIINFMATHGRGLICTPIEEERAAELQLNMMVNSNTALHETAFTVSIDLVGQGCSTGISAYDRATGIKAIVDPKTKASDFARPGHIFPLKAKAGGVLRRLGHTEAAVDLAKLAGFYPAGVLVEILNEDGTMARLPELVDLAHQHQLKIISIDDLVAYRMNAERLVEQVSTTRIDTRYGELDFVTYKQKTTGDVHLAIKKGEWEADEPVLVRVHSVDRLTEMFNLALAKEPATVEKALHLIAEEGKGLLILMRHSEKEKNVLDLMKSLGKSESELTQAKEREGLNRKDYGTGAQIIRALGISKIRLMTNNPNKKLGISGYGIEVVENVGL